MALRILQVKDANGSVQVVAAGHRLDPAQERRTAEHDIERRAHPLRRLDLARSELVDMIDHERSATAAVEQAGQQIGIEQIAAFDRAMPQKDLRRRIGRHAHIGTLRTDRDRPDLPVPRQGMVGKCGSDRCGHIRLPWQAR